MISFSFFHFSQELLAVDIDRHHYKTPAREFDTLKSKKVPQSLEIGLFFVKFLFLLYSNI